MGRRERCDKGRPRVDASRKICAEFALLSKSQRESVLQSLQTIHDLDLQIPEGKVIEESKQIPIPDAGAGADTKTEETKS